MFPERRFVFAINLRYKNEDIAPNSFYKFIKRLAEEYVDLVFVYLIHLNPNLLQNLNS